jgi:hypothetical protein
MKELMLKNLTERLERLHKEEDEITFENLGIHYIDSLIKIHKEEDEIIDRIASDF